MKLAVVQTFLLDESVMLVSEVIVVFKLFLGEDFQEFGVDGVGVAKGLDRRKGSEIMEVVVCVREESDL
jgi:hypothetical protein